MTETTVDETPKIDVGTPSVARVWGAQHGSKDTFAPDREVAEKVNDECRAAGIPTGEVAAREHAAFVGRAVDLLASDFGISQFIDVGAGMPRANMVHEIAREIDPDARVVFVDNDALVLVHARALLATDDGIGVVEADMRDPATILGDPGLTEVIDLTEPVAVIFAAVLHWMTDEDDPAAIVARFVEALPPGSFVVISHAASDGYEDGAAALAGTLSETGGSFVPRDHAAVSEMFAGLTLVSPGVVYPGKWHPDQFRETIEAARWMHVGVAAKELPEVGRDEDDPEKPLRRRRRRAAREAV